MRFIVPSSALLRCFFSLALLVGISSVVVAQPYTPSPTDWRDEVIYQVLTDRIYDGNPSNNATGTTFNATNGSLSHGGDWDGLRSKIPYMKALGVTAVWISPVQKNVNGAYHGYHASDFTAAAPNFGGLTALQTLSKELHANGMLLILDVVPNHGGDLIRNNNTYRVPPNTYTLSYRNNAIQHAPPFTSLDCWHAQGTINNYSGNEQILGELSGLDDLKTERADIRTTLTQIFSDWITSTDADGFRIDTVKHVDMAFWQNWTPAIRAHAATLGKSNFFTFGEVFDGNAAFVGQFTGTKAGGAYALDSCLDYPLYYQTNNVFGYQSSGGQAITDYFNSQPSNYDPYAVGRMVTNVENHDNPRFLSSNIANNDVARLRAVNAFQLLAPGIPCLYYGTEQDFNGAGDPGCREDMFDGQFEQGPSLGDNFNMASAGFLQTRKLNQLRRDVPALRRGGYTGRQGSYSPGAFAFSRIASGESEVIVAMNTGSGNVSGAAWSTTYSPGTVLTDALDPAWSTTVNGSGQIPAGTALGPQAVRVIMPAALVPNWAPWIESASIPHDSRPLTTLDVLDLTFSEPMTTPTVNASFVTTASLAVTLSWNTSGTVLSVAPPAGGWPTSGLLRFGISASATDLTGTPMGAGYELLWNITSGTPPPPPITDPTIDGLIVGDARYTAPLTTQTVQTGFGDNTAGSPSTNVAGSELDGLYIYETTGTLYLGVTGNLENNGNTVAILFDLDGSGATGTNSLNGTGATNPWLVGTQGADGTILPTGFGCDVALLASSSSGGSVAASVLRWSSNGSFAEESDLGVGAGTSGQPTRAVLVGTVNGSAIQVSVGLDNRHTGPVEAGSAASASGGASAAYGLELALPRSVFGGTVGRRVLVGLSGSTGYWSNQFLPPITPAANLGWAPNLSGVGATSIPAPAVPVALSRFSAE